MAGTLDVFERALSQHNLKLSSLNVMMFLGSTESIKLFLEHTDCMGIVSIRSVPVSYTHLDVYKRQVYGS